MSTCTSQPCNPRQGLQKYQVYGDSVLKMYGEGPSLRDIIKPLFGLFHSEPGNGAWKRKAALLSSTVRETPPLQAPLRPSLFRHIRVWTILTVLDFDVCCTVRISRQMTVKSFLEETMSEIPDFVMDAPLGEASSNLVNTFAKAKTLLPPPYTVQE